MKVLAYPVRREDTKTSKRFIFRVENGEEEKFLSGDFDFSAGHVYVLDVDDTPGRYGMRIIHGSLPASEEDSKMMIKRFGPSPVPSVKEMVELAVSIVNSVPDSSYSYQTRPLTTHQVNKAFQCYFNNDKDEMQKFLVCPASTRYHDSQEGGLIRHIYGMLKILKSWWSGLDDYENYSLHPLIVVTGILFHDLGKVRQYDILEGGGYAQAEDASYMHFHIGFGSERWAQKGNEICEILGNPDMYKDILHLIKSHHGPISHELGSEADPFGPDAWTLHAIDLLQSQQEKMK